ncbi:hypothetical protein A2334_04045 [Candidatus Roizmanbacteria bacterium RIFOXYB2_FULL_38_10]|uniref:VanZ-like domain-containing protein n=1 Tax=Candidatus Roizmanbacteria bacterium RIFOXYD1_FULL_38_12 TaxID=1802093 RepID=A0A1F7KZA0_9BACT|nr:MAG: hypothetical protein A3K47_00155 [Candidatus Roizmanbacteria bacterium RIFOXYA2_FULL_38_14]OGK63214.1 MAG: hypothetical protein A3K27_00155 [Candidatus Roizmanbacteria bacterium RIFOXYA1_FULL_37_12]OGK65060.1 MAG: hypothetical protein A3K38_00155 [Candidatus Roizmanbacteria bacterium RIFOXYB1_FULL_40_23]OGK68615.1 MAG: hypothetical protein A2334_04045 [Candidatus Roizmanbacteria bacterium RIFOXYB2_FULL_38_10]OGK69463.1 MAG: hypothetical protein A3K21_00155 [Candidatus Roizmanbacteria ba
MAVKHPLLRFLYYWLPPFLWMALIFYLSSRKSIGITHAYLYDFVIFKSLHVIEYAVLFFFIFRALHTTKFSLSHQFILAIVCSVLFATSDEIHQLFISSRQGKVRDILIDTAGILIMYIITKKNLKFVKRLI